MTESIMKNDAAPERSIILKSSILIYLLLAGPLLLISTAFYPKEDGIKDSPPAPSLSILAHQFTQNYSGKSLTLTDLKKCIWICLTTSINRRSVWQVIMDARGC